MTEIWKSSGYEGYEASNLGRVRNAKTGKILKGHPNEKGYMRVCLKKYQTTFLHRVIASAFLERPEGCTEINHKDGNKKNNCVDNLEWCTHQQNMHHAAKNGLREGVNVKITKSDVEYVKNHPNDSTRTIGKTLGYSHTTIRRIKMMLVKPKMDDRPKEDSNGETE